MSEAPPSPTGLLDAARLFGGQLVATVKDRVTLLSVELQEEKLRLTQMLLWVSAIVFAGIMALTFGTLLLVYLWWDSARLALLAGLTLAYGGAAAALIWAFQRFLRRQPAPLAATLEELEADAQCIRPQT
jgi:uncharacterized membrane protein YqjE